RPRAPDTLRTDRSAAHAFSASADKRKSHQIACILGIFKGAADRDQLVKLACTNGQPWDYFAKPSSFLGVVPDELAAAALTTHASAVTQKNGHSRSKQRLLMRGNQAHSVHQVKHLRGVLSVMQQRKPAPNDSVRGVIVGAPNRRPASPVG